jgi:4-hydroxy-tetrahydrodipicolinate synthase
LHGVGNSLYTPFCGQDGDDIDWDAYSILVRHCVGTVGHSMLRVTSGLAEFWSLTIGERKRLLEVAVEEARAINKEVVVQSCTAALSAKECLELTRHAQQAGADIVYIQPRRDIRHGGRAGRQVGPRRGAGSRPVGTTRACRPRDCGGPV